MAHHIVEIQHYEDAELPSESIPHDMPRYRVRLLHSLGKVLCCAGNTQRFHGARQAKLDGYPANPDKTAF